jgi:hypothetical protein
MWFIFNLLQEKINQTYLQYTVLQRSSSWGVCHWMWSYWSCWVCGWCWHNLGHSVPILTACWFFTRPLFTSWDVYRRLHCPSMGIVWLGHPKIPILEQLASVSVFLSHLNIKGKYRPGNMHSVWILTIPHTGYTQGYHSTKLIGSDGSAATSLTGLAQLGKIKWLKASILQIIVPSQIMACLKTCKMTTQCPEQLPGDEQTEGLDS